MLSSLSRNLFSYPKRTPFLPQNRKVMTNNRDFRVRGLALSGLRCPSPAVSPRRAKSHLYRYKGVYIYRIQTISVDSRTNLMKEYKSGSAVLKYTFGSSKYNLFLSEVLIRRMETSARSSWRRRSHGNGSPSVRQRRRGQ